MESILDMAKPAKSCSCKACTCQHPKAYAKKYVGSQETYMYCPECFETWGGEETPAKKALIAAAARYEEKLAPWEQAEL